MKQKGQFNINSTELKFIGEIDNSEKYLTVEFSFLNNSENEDKFPNYFESMPGILEDGSYIILFECNILRSYHSFTNLMIKVYRIKYIFKSLEKLDNIIVNNLNFRLTNLENYISNSGLNYREVKSERHNFEINYHLPEEIQLISIEGLNIFIDFGLRGSYSNIPTKIDLVQYSTIRLETTQENKFNFFEDIAIYIGKFLSLCSFSKSIPFECEFLNSNSNYKSKIEVLRSGYNSKDFSNNSTSDPIISFKELSFNKFILQNYLENRSNYEIVINLLFDTFFIKEYFDENSFLNIIQAYEAYFERFLKKDFQNTNNTIKKITLDMKIKDIFLKLPDKISNQISSDLIQLKKYAVASRNYYTHYTNKKNENVLDNLNLFILTENLKFIILYVLLLNLGIDSELLEEDLYKHKRSKFLQVFFGQIDVA
jgi:hypothetical protein